MGNKLAIDLNEVAINGLYLLGEDQQPVCIETKLVKVGVLDINGSKTQTIKANLRDLDNIVKDEQEKSNIDNLVKHLLDPNAEKVEILVTGYGFDEYNEQLLSFIKQFCDEFAFVKFKQIKYCASAMNTLINETKEKFYVLRPLEVTTLNQDLNENTGVKFTKKYFNHDELKKPYMVVNIKSGVSYYKIDTDGTANRLSGSLIGESTYSSLIKLLTNYRSIEESVEDCYLGDNRTVDMTVGDIYGGSYENLKLAKDIIASSFGKGKYLKVGDAPDRDVARSVVMMLCINIAQLSVMISDVEELDHIVVLGSMLTQEVFQKIIASFICYWSGKRKEAIFPEKAEFLGSLGILLEDKCDK